jgi:hypothetical protein
VKVVTVEINALHEYCIPGTILTHYIIESSSTPSKARSSDLFCR